MNVVFRLGLRDDRWVEESELSGELPLDAIADRPELEGAIVLGGEVEIEDALGNIALNLCARAARELSAGRTALFETYTYDSEVRLEPVGEDIEVSGRFVPTTRFERAPLLDGLVACGERIVALMRRVPPNERTAETIAEELAATRAALGSASGHSV